MYSSALYLENFHFAYTSETLHSIIDFPEALGQYWLVILRRIDVKDKRNEQLFLRYSEYLVKHKFPYWTEGYFGWIINVTELISAINKVCFKSNPTVN